MMCKVGGKEVLGFEKHATAGSLRHFPLGWWSWLSIIRPHRLQIRKSIAHALGENPRSSLLISTNEMALSRKRKDVSFLLPICRNYRFHSFDFFHDFAFRSEFLHNQFTIYRGQPSFSIPEAKEPNRIVFSTRIVILLLTQQFSLHWKWAFAFLLLL